MPKFRCSESCSSAHGKTYGRLVVVTWRRLPASLEMKTSLLPPPPPEHQTSEVALQFFVAVVFVPPPVQMGHGCLALSLCGVQSTWTRYGAVKLTTLAVAKQRNAKNGHGLVSASLPLVFLEKCPRPSRAPFMPSLAAVREIARFLLVKWVQTRSAIGGEGLF